MEVVLECLFIVGIVYASIIPHELAHIVMLKYYGIDSHLEFKRGEEDRRVSLFSLAVIPNDESTVNLDRKSIGVIAASGGITSMIFIMICYGLFWSYLSIVGIILLLVFIVYHAIYAVWETKMNLDLNKR